MKSVYLSLSLVLFSALPTMADTVVYEDGTALVARLDAIESESLYESLDLEASQARSGLVKVFVTAERAAQVYCYKKTVPVGDPYGCTLTIDRAAASRSTPVFEENGSLHASVNDLEEAQALFEALEVEEHEGRSGSGRYFYAEDRKASIHCTKSSIPVGIPYGCRISIELP